MKLWKTIYTQIIFIKTSRYDSYLLKFLLQLLPEHFSTLNCAQSLVIVTVWITIYLQIHKALETIYTEIWITEIHDTKPT